LYGNLVVIYTNVTQVLRFPLMSCISESTYDMIERTRHPQEERYRGTNSTSLSIAIPLQFPVQIGCYPTPHSQLPQFSSTATPAAYTDIVFAHLCEVRLDVSAASSRFSRHDTSIKIHMLLQYSDVPMQHCGIIVGLLGKNIIQAQVTAILYRIHRGLQHHSNPAYKNITNLLQVVFQIRLLNGEFVGTLRLSMRSSSFLMHHILQSALLHDTSDECCYFTAELFSLESSTHPSSRHRQPSLPGAQHPVHKKGPSLSCPRIKSPTPMQ
jgi:hypothetical protein